MGTGKLVAFFFFFLTMSPAPRRFKHPVPSKCSINICYGNGNAVYKMLWEWGGETGSEKKSKY